MGALRPGGGGGVADSSITAAKLASDAVTQAKIADDAVGAAEIKDSEASSIRSTIGAAAGIDTGTYAARPASPSAGDRYLVTSGVRKGSLYACVAAGYWYLERVVLPPELQTELVLYLDGEDLQGVSVLRWRNHAPSQIGNDMLAVTAGGTFSVGTSSLSAGLPYLEATNAARMQTGLPFPLTTGGRTVAVLTSNVGQNNTYATNHLVFWGATSTNRAFGIASKNGGLNNWGVEPYGVSSYNSGVSSTQSAAARIVARYNGSQISMYKNGAIMGSAGSFTLSAPAAGNISVLSLFSQAEATTATVSSGTRLHAVYVATSYLDDTALGILDAWLLERHGS